MNDFQTYIKSPERIEVGPAYGAVSDLAKTEWMHGYTLRGIWRCQNGSVTISLEALHLDERVKLNLHVGDRVVYIDGEPAVMNRSELAGYEPEPQLWGDSQLTAEKIKAAQDALPADTYPWIHGLGEANFALRRQTVKDGMVSFNRPVPEPIHSHIADALRYGVGSWRIKGSDILKKPQPVKGVHTASSSETTTQRKLKLENGRVRVTKSEQLSWGEVMRALLLAWDWGDGHGR